MNALQLDAMPLEPPTWAVPGMIPEGVTMFTGQAEVGKSRVTLDLGHSVATGTPWLGSFPVVQGQVLYCDLETSEYRLQQRSRAWSRVRNQPVSDAIEFELSWPKTENGGLEQLAQYIEDLDLRMVVIDTLAKIQQVPAHYNAAYPAMARLSELGRAHHCAIVVVHHQLRVGSSSRRWQERIQGSMGSLAGCDAAMGMMEDPKSKQMNLNVGGKDVAAQTILLTSQDGMWTAGLEAEQTADDDGLTDSRKALVEIVKAEGGGVPAKLIAERSGRPYANIRQQLHQMVQMAQLLRHLRLYYTPEQYSQLLADLDPQQTFLAPPQWDLRPRESIRGDGTNA